MTVRPHNPLYGRDIDGERFISDAALAVGDRALPEQLEFQEFCRARRSEGYTSHEAAAAWRSQ